MAKFHAKRDALATIAALTIPIEEGSRFGIIQIDEEWRITGFQEKPGKPNRDTRHARILPRINGQLYF